MTLPQLTTITPSLQKKYDRLPKATEVFISACACFHKKPWNNIYPVDLFFFVLTLDSVFTYTMLAHTGDATLHGRDR